MHQVLVLAASIDLSSLDVFLDLVNSVGGKILDIVIQGAYWFFIVMTGTEIVKKGKDRDFTGCIRTGVEGALGFGATKIAQLLMNIIKEVKA